MNKQQMIILREHIDEVETEQKDGYPGMSYEEGMRDILDLIEDGYTFDDGNDDYTQEFIQGFE